MNIYKMPKLIFIFSPTLYNSTIMLFKQIPSEFPH